MVIGLIRWSWDFPQCPMVVGTLLGEITSQRPSLCDILWVYNYYQTVWGRCKHRMFLYVNSQGRHKYKTGEIEAGITLFRLSFGYSRADSITYPSFKNHPSLHLNFNSLSAHSLEHTQTINDYSLLGVLIVSRARVVAHCRSRNIECYWFGPVLNVECRIPWRTCTVRFVITHCTDHENRRSRVRHHWLCDRLTTAAPIASNL